VFSPELKSGASIGVRLGWHRAKLGRSVPASGGLRPYGK
jgi:hypothetical protein